MGKVAVVALLVGCGRLAPNEAAPDASADTGASQDVAVSPPSMGVDAGPTPPAITLAGSQTHPDNLVVRAGTAYWTTSDTLHDYIVKCDVDGCGGTPIVVETTNTTIRGLQTDGVNVYWTSDDDDVSSCPVSGCGTNDAARTILSNAPYSHPLGIAVGSTSVYWDTGGTDAVLGCAASGCGQAPTPIALSQAGPVALTVDSTNIYWANAATSGPQSSAVLACALTGCGAGPTVLAAGQPAPHGLVVGGGNAYWVTAKGDVMSCSVDGCFTSSLIASGQSIASTSYALAIDDVALYWANGSTGTIVSCPLSGGEGVPTVVGLASGSVAAIAVDATSLYWVDDTASAVLKLSPK